ncbi:MAG: DNA-3-methyladenine glycosylase I [Chitinophagales bacterium]|nr:DNA-3-methyladenine glycosylase I [Bacteroidota bacterium]MCB9042554.1 DNA-3-methyladenine glycosylase I [Chitinophagales bacterium]
MAQTYCDYVGALPENNVHKIYHDTQYGFPIDDDDALFERLILEINQAGLSWNTILHKQNNFRKAYDNFSIKKVAAYADTDIHRLLNDAGIIRNKLKINAAIYNAQQVLALQQQFGSFKNWLDQHHPQTLEQWVKIFRKTFKFTGGEIINEFLMSCGYLYGAHTETCPSYAKVLAQNPAWAQ